MLVGWLVDGYVLCCGVEGWLNGEVPLTNTVSPPFINLSKTSIFSFLLLADRLVD